MQESNNGEVKRDLREYIIKQNDRNIQRQREKGFTLYAIYGALIYCFFYLIDNIEILFNIIGNFRSLLAATITVNISFSLYYIHLALAISLSPLKATRIYLDKRWFKLATSDYPIFIIFFVMALLNIYNLRFSQNSYHKIYSLLFGTIYILNTVSPLALSMWIWKVTNSKKKRGLTIEEIDFTMGNEKLRGSFSAGAILYSALLLVLTITLLIQLKPHFSASEISNVVKYVLIFQGAIYLLRLVTAIHEKEQDNNRLEEFEREIFFNNIPNDQIKERFEKDFGTISLLEWLSEKNATIKAFFHDIQQSFVAMDHEFANLERVDKDQYPARYGELVEAIISRRKMITQQTFDFVQRNQNSFNNLKTYASLNNHEFLELDYVQNFLNQNIKHVNSQLANISKKIDKIIK